MVPNFTPGSDEHEQQLFQEQQDFLYSVLISSLKTEFSELLSKTMREMPNSSLSYYMGIIQATLSIPELRLTESPSI